MRNREDAPEVVVEGIEVVIERDLKKHQIILNRTKEERLAYLAARSHEIAKKKHYRKLIGGGKFNDDSLRMAIDQIRVNVQHFSDKIKLTDDKIEHETLIVDTLAKQLADQISSLEALTRWKISHAVPH